MKGSSSAIAIEGEMPGSAPPRMPQSVPPKAVAITHGSVKAPIQIPPNSVPAGKGIPITRTKPNQNTMPVHAAKATSAGPGLAPA